MAGATFPRIKNWGATDTVINTDLNAEFDNILNNLLPAGMDSYSHNQAQMQLQSNPGGVGTESLATSLAGELERIRFVLAEVTGNTFWYQAPIASLSQLNTAIGAAALQNKISSGLTNGATGSVQPVFLVPDGTAAKVNLKATATNFVYSIQGSTYTVTADASITGLTTAPTTGNTALVADTSMSGQAWTKQAGEGATAITISTVGANISALVGKLTAFKNNTSSEVFIGRVATATSITDCRRGYFFNSASSTIARAGLTSGDTLTLLQLTWVFVGTTGNLLISYSNPAYGGTQPTSPAIGDYWFDTGNNLWKIYTGTLWVSANALLIGICAQSTTGTIAARSFDFYEAFSSLNTAELFLDANSAANVRSRYVGAQLSVYGTQISAPQGYWSWTSPGSNASGVTVTNGNFYFFYVDLKGNTIIDSVAPHDRRADLQGFYHPSNTYRCLGYAYATGNDAFSSVETFYRNDNSGLVQPLTAAATNFPQPDLISVSPIYIPLDTSGGNYTQFLPPISSFKGKMIYFMKVSTDYNIATIQVAEATVLTTTQSCTFAQTTITCASSTGLTTGLIVSGNGIPRGATVTAFTATTATLSQPVFTTQASAAVTFGQAGGILNNLNVTAATFGETWGFFCDGTRYIPREHTYNTDWVSFPSTAVGTFLTATTTVPTYGTVTENILKWRREGNGQRIFWNFGQSAAGNSGSGTYLVNQAASLPAFDISQTSTNASAVAHKAAVGKFQGTAVTTAANYIGSIRVYNSTQLYADVATVVGGASGSWVASWSSAAGGAGFGVTGIQNYSIDALIPLVGWVG